MKNSTNKISLLAVTSCAAFALVAFAANSILCRLALVDGAIDAASFTTIRLVSGALVLGLLLKLPPFNKPVKSKGSWFSATILFFYAAAFSFAYNTLSTGTGALILFGAVQLTMLIAALLCGERFRCGESLGVLAAFAGLVYLVLPGVTAPSLSGSLLMTGAGIAWGIYSLKGRGSAAPLADTTGNFTRSLPFVAALSFFFLREIHVTFTGALLAVLSGGLASGLGYAVWYAALQGMTSIRASIVQLAVPVLAALGGVLFLSEVITLRLIVATLAILGGVGLAVAGRGSDPLFGAAPPEGSSTEEDPPTTGTHFWPKKPPQT
jgi:drug/metabolite transporter (DMT)-like permease